MARTHSPDRRRRRKWPRPDPRAAAGSRFPELIAPDAMRGIHAVGVLPALWKNLLRVLARLSRRLGVALAGVAGVVGSTVAGAPGWVTAVAAVVAAAGGVLALGPLLGLARLAVAGVVLHRRPWQDYTCHPSFPLFKEGEPRAVTLYLKAGDGTVGYSMRLRGRRTVVWRGLTRPHAWVAGRPGGIAVVVPAGGGELFVARLRRR